MRYLAFILMAFMSCPLAAQPILESGRVLGPGNVLRETTLAGWPIQQGKDGYFGFIQHQVQSSISRTPHSIWNRLEFRYAVAAGYSPNKLHVCALIGAQYLIYRAQSKHDWDLSAALTTSYLRGDQLLPQHKFWLAGTRMWNHTELNINGGICQNYRESPLHWHFGAGILTPVHGKWYAHFEVYGQPDHNSALQIGLEHRSTVMNTVFMIIAAPGSVPGPTLVRYHIQ